MLAGYQGVFQTGHRRRLSPHAFGDLGLREARFSSSAQDRIEHGHFVPFDALVLCTNGGVLEHLLYELFMGLHVVSPSDDVPLKVAYSWNGATRVATLPHPHHLYRLPQPLAT